MRQATERSERGCAYALRDSSGYEGFEADAGRDRSAVMVQGLRDRPRGCEDAKGAGVLAKIGGSRIAMSLQASRLDSFAPCAKAGEYAPCGR
jgi:hypothetical protein